MVAQAINLMWQSLPMSRTIRIRPWSAAKERGMSKAAQASVTYAPAVHNKTAQPDHQIPLRRKDPRIRREAASAAPAPIQMLCLFQWGVPSALISCRCATCTPPRGWVQGGCDFSMWSGWSTRSAAKNWKLAQFQVLLGYLRIYVTQ